MEKEESKAKEREVSEHQAHTERKLLHRGKVLSFVTDTLSYADGKVKTFELALHPGAVVMIPIDDDDNLIFVKQWRRGSRQVMIELPAGTLEPKEDPILCAQRELREEIGYRSDHLSSLGGFFTAPGFCSEYLYLFLAKKLIADPLHGDDSDEIDRLSASLEEAKEWIQSGAIVDAKTIIGIYRYRDWLQRRLL